MDGSTILTTSAVTVDAAEFRAAIAFAQQTIERRNTIPVIGMLRLMTVDGENGHALHLTATNLDTQLEVTIAADLVGPHFATTLAPDFIAKMIRHESGPVLMEMDDKRILRIAAGDMKASVREVCTADDFPEMRAMAEWHDATQIPQALLHKVLTAVIPCISTEETRYYLNGVYLHAHEGKLRAVATDGHRLARYDADFAWPIVPVIFPRDAVKVLARKVAASNQDVTISATLRNGADAKDAAALRIQGDGWTMTAKTIDGTFPDYNRVIPPENDTLQATISHAAIRRFPYVERSVLVKLHPDEGVMSVQSPDGHTVSMPVQGKGGPFGFNLRYLLDFASRTTALRIEGASSRDPFRILTDDPALLQVIMPMRT